MAVPEIVSIAYEPDRRTDMIGRYADGQFLASITYAFPEGFSHGEGWEDAKRLYTVLHRFDFDGRHVDSDIWCAGTWREQQQRRDRADLLATPRCAIPQRATPRCATPRCAMRGAASGRAGLRGGVIDGGRLHR